MTLKEIKVFLETYKPTAQPINLSVCETITNQKNFIESHLSALENHKGNRRFLPYFDRLARFVEIMKTQKE